MDSSNYYQNISHTLNDSWKAKFWRVVNSSFLLVIAFVFSSYINYWVMALAASMMGLQPSVSYEGLFNMPDTASGYTRWSILIIYASGPLFCLSLGIFFVLLYHKWRKDKNLLKVLMLWAGVCCINVFLSSAIFSAFGAGKHTSPFYQGFSVIFAWLYIDPVFVSILSFFALLIALVIGYQCTSAFLGLSFSTRIANNYRERFWYLIQVVLLPWLLGAVLLVASSISSEHNVLFYDSFNVLIRLMGILILILPMFFKLQSVFHVKVNTKYDVLGRSSIYTFMALMITLILLRSVLVIRIPL